MAMFAGVFGTFFETQNHRTFLALHRVNRPLTGGRRYLSASSGLVGSSLWLSQISVRYDLAVETPTEPLAKHVKVSLP